jgi:hypothetical protein
MTCSTTRKDFFENTVRIEAVEFGKSSVLSKYIPARVGERTCGAFTLLPIDRRHVEVICPHDGGKSHSRQVIELIRFASPRTGEDQLLRCPRCEKKRRRLFFISQETTAATDFSFTCADCALAILGSTLPDRVQVVRRRRHK